MASSSSSSPTQSQNHHPNTHNNPLTHFIQSRCSNFLSLFNPPPLSISTTTTSSSSSSSSSISNPLLFSETPPPQPPILSLSAMPTTPFDSPSSSHTNQSNPMTPNSESVSASFSGSGLPSTVKISGPNGGGPAFLGQVFSMCDISGTGLMAVSAHIELPKRIPEWIRKTFAKVIKSENNDPMFQFFMDLGDAVSYVKKLNIPTGVVGACRLDLAYEHFKEKPHMFQFVPNEKQVKEANKILRTIRQRSGRRKVDGVPVFTAENLDIAIATNDGIKWYTPYFFDKNILDIILEESVDQHFHSLIQSRHVQRRRDVGDDSLSAEIADVFEENADNPWEPPEVQDVLDEIGIPEIPLSIISKAAEIELLYAVDKVVLGNRWLRKATGIQPKFPYMVDSFEKRSASSFLKAAESIATSSEAGSDNKTQECLVGSELRSEESTQGGAWQLTSHTDFRFPFGDWFSNPWSKQERKRDDHVRLDGTQGEFIKQVPPSPLLPKITMVGISTAETGQMSGASLKKTMENLTRELEQSVQNNNDSEGRYEDRDPLFVANVGDYYNMAKTGSVRYVHAGNN